MMVCEVKLGKPLKLKLVNMKHQRHSIPRPYLVYTSVITRSNPLANSSGAASRGRPPRLQTSPGYPASRLTTAAIPIAGVSGTAPWSALPSPPKRSQHPSEIPRKLNTLLVQKGVRREHEKSARV